MSDIDIDALKKALKIREETPSRFVSRGFYQGLCEKTIEIINQLQIENKHLRKLLFLAASWMGTDDPDWPEVRYVEAEIEKLKK